MVTLGLVGYFGVGADTQINNVRPHLLDVFFSTHSLKRHLEKKLTSMS